MPISIAECCDCMDFMSRYEDNFFDLAIVDPPYGIGYDVSANKANGTQYGVAKAAKRNYKSSNWDNSIPDKKYFIELFRVSKNQIIWGGNYFTDFLYQTKGWIFWYKHTNGDFSDGELAWTSFGKPLKVFDFLWNGMLQGNMSNKQERIHPTEKPFQLYQWCLREFAKKSDKILDTHLGSGSNRCAAFKGNFDFYSTELDAITFEAQEKRFKEAIAQPLFDNLEPTNNIIKQSSLFE